LLVYVASIYILIAGKSSFWSSNFNISSQDIHPEVTEWIAESDISGKGVFVLRLSRERTDQFFFGQARPADQELPDDVFGAFIYINSFENDDIERIFGRTEVVGSTLSVFYRTKGTHEPLEDLLYDFYYDEPLEDYDIDYVKSLYDHYTDEQYINYFSGYELSSISVSGDIGITNLKIFINGEKVDFRVNMLD